MSLSAEIAMSAIAFLSSSTPLPVLFGTILFLCLSDTLSLSFLLHGEVSSRVSLVVSRDIAKEGDAQSPARRAKTARRERPLKVGSFRVSHPFLSPAVCTVRLPNWRALVSKTRFLSLSLCSCPPTLLLLLLSHTAHFGITSHSALSNTVT